MRERMSSAKETAVRLVKLKVKGLSSSNTNATSNIKNRSARVTITMLEVKKRLNG